MDPIVIQNVVPPPKKSWQRQAIDWVKYIIEHRKAYVVALGGVLHALVDVYRDLPDEAKHKFHAALIIVILRLMMDRK